MALLDLLEPKVIKIPLEGTNKTEVLQELVQVLVDAGRIEGGASDAILNALWDREAKGTTGLEDGIAVPHAKTASVDKMYLAMGVAPDGVDFQAMDGNPSKLFFLILAPPDQAGPHIEALSEIARLTRSKSFCRLLLGSRNAEEVLELFQED